MKSSPYVTRIRNCDTYHASYRISPIVLLYDIMISIILKENGNKYKRFNLSTLNLTFEFYAYEFKLFDLWFTMIHITTIYGLSEIYGTYIT